MVKFLGDPLQIPDALSNVQAVRKQYVDVADKAIRDRVVALESSVSLAVKDVTAAYTAVAGDFVLANAAGANFTVTLPSHPPTNTTVAVKKTDSSTHIVTVQGSDGSTIDGDPVIYLPAPQAAAQFVFDGANWKVAGVVVYDTGVIPFFTYRGAYNASTGYLVNDVVYFQGNSYIAISANTGVAPAIDASSATWGLIALHGVKGDTGATGPTGAAGSGGGSGSGSGGFTAIVTKTAAYTAAAYDFVLANASGGAFTVTLPASPAVNTEVAVKKVDASANHVTVVGSGGATIDGDATAVINTGQAGATFIYDGTNWRVESTMVLEGASTFTYLGEYSNTGSYRAGDVVSYLGGSYVALAATTGTAPASGGSSATWGVIATKGSTGADGATGPAGSAATVSVGSTTTGAAGSNASVTNSGSSSAAVLNFSVPRGAAGTSFTYRGTYNNATTYVVNDVVYYQGYSYINLTGSTGTVPTLANSSATWGLMVSKGDVGPQGNPGTSGTNGTNGAAATVTAGTTTTGAAGTNASVTNSGSSSAAVFNFTIPRGTNGTNGTNGATGPAGPTVNLVGSLAAPTTPTTMTTTGTEYQVFFDVSTAENSAYATVTTGSNGRVTVNVSGWYEITGGVGFSGNATGYRQVSVRVGGTLYNGSGNILNAAGTATCVVPVRPLMVNISAGTAITLHVIQTGAAGLTTATGTQFCPTLNVSYMGNF